MFNYPTGTFTKEEEKIIDNWSNIYNAFNSVEYDSDTGEFYITGPDYDKDDTRGTKEDILGILECDIKEFLYFSYMNGELLEQLEIIEKIGEF